MSSTIGQVSGEDWKNVVLSVSNVTPLRGGYLPGAYPWFLDIPRADVVRKGTVQFAAPAAAPAPASAPEQQVAKEEPQEAGLAFAQRGETPLSVEYRLPGRVTVESSERETYLPLFSKQLEGQFSYYAVPKASALLSSCARQRRTRRFLPAP